MFNSVAALCRRLNVEKKEVRTGRVYIQRLHAALKVNNVLGGILLLEQTFGLVLGIFERLQVKGTMGSPLHSSRTQLEGLPKDNQKSSPLIFLYVLFCSM